MGRRSDHAPHCHHPACLDCVGHPGSRHIPGLRACRRLERRGERLMSSPNSRASALAFPKATASRSYQHQRQMRTGRGNPWGTCAPVCVAGNDPQHDRSGNRAGFIGLPNPSKTRRGFGLGGLSRIQIPTIDRSGFLPRSVGQLRGCAVKAAPRYFHSVRALGLTPSRAQSLANQHLHKLAVAKIHHLTNRLSSSAVSVGIDPNENGLTHAQTSFAPGAKAND